jgi:hypothetical protein
MSNGNQVKDAADAVKGIVEAVPVYQDALQPAAREIGTGLQTIARTIHIALAPISALVWGYDQIKEFVCARVAEKLKDVPPERIRTPAPNVVGPALEALRYTGHQESLRELYANLLATSLDAETAEQAHPAFVDMIKNMSPDEARIMRLFAARRAFPVIDVRWHNKGEQNYQFLLRSFCLIGREAGCSFPDLMPNYLDNLSRLGLLESPGAHALGATMMQPPNVYEPLEDSDEIKRIKDSLQGSDGRVDFGRTFVRVTDLGSQFCRACVIEKSAAAQH